LTAEKWPSVRIITGEIALNLLYIKGLIYLEVSMIQVARYLALSAITAICSISFAQSYTISSKMEILKPVGIEAMKTDAQTVRVLSETPSTVIVELSVDPTFNQVAGLMPNSNWKSENANNPKLRRYLEPGITTNWDPQMKSELLDALVQDGIKRPQQHL
jgi:hypothetical protein